jgi:effector-binding domain-containing protein
MFKIGEFSSLSRVTTKTLRYYDQIGLLKPAQVDEWTGYRYYSASQLARLNRILALKDLGLALDQIAHLLEGDLSPDQIRGILRLKQAELEQQLRDERAQLERVEYRLRLIEQEESMSTQEVAIKSVPAQAVASLRDNIPISQLGQLFGEVFGYLGPRGLAPVGPPVGIYHDEEFKQESMDVEVAVPVSGAVPASERVTARQLPAVEKMACIIHEGAYETVGGSYGQLMTWVENNGYRMCGPVREVYVRGPESGDDSSTYVTEIQLPVERE